MKNLFFVIALGMIFSSQSFAQNNVLYKCGGTGSTQDNGNDIIRVEKEADGNIHLTLQMGPYKPANENLRDLALMTGQPYNSPEFATVLNFDFATVSCTSTSPLDCTSTLNSGVKVEAEMKFNLPNPNYDFPNYDELKIQSIKGTDQAVMFYDCTRAPSPKS